MKSIVLCLQLILLNDGFTVSKADDSNPVISDVENLREYVVRLQGALGDYEDRFKKLESANRALWNTVQNQNQQMNRMGKDIQDLQETVQRQQIELETYSKICSDIANVSGYREEETTTQNDVIGGNDQTKYREPLSKSTELNRLPYSIAMSYSSPSTCTLLVI
jgi:predicted nuclease with TOPRIM domain